MPVCLPSFTYRLAIRDRKLERGPPYYCSLADSRASILLVQSIGLLAYVLTIQLRGYYEVIIDHNYVTQHVHFLSFPAKGESGDSYACTSTTS
jgi:hypothetical protein